MISVMLGKRFYGIVFYTQDKYNRARRAIRVFDTQDFRSNHLSIFLSNIA